MFVFIGIRQTEVTDRRFVSGLNSMNIPEEMEHSRITVVICRRAFNTQHDSQIQQLQATLDKKVSVDIFYALHSILPTCC